MITQIKYSSISQPRPWNIGPILEIPRVKSYLVFIDLLGTPVRLFKHRIQTAAENATRTHASPHVPHLILGVVSQCKLQGGICMAELRQLLAAGGFDVTQNKWQVNQRLPKKETVSQTTRNSSSRLNDMVKGPLTLKCDLFTSIFQLCL